ncbi:hypothetical protein Pmani_029650 [Petrolisthes manimaculis]|uniref:Thymosin beta n=1 Tax=Petrolisthes manimaculis TaxID=1843537 RepID=A0AAE1NYW4_9EUCA|nr:hypothetical protein Pmani_029650 [Petrolisthes manimaculis]
MSLKHCQPVELGISLSYDTCAVKPPSITTTTNMSAADKLKDLPKVDSVLKEQLEGFSPDKLKKTDTSEKTALPTKEDVAAEKQAKAHLDAVEGFNAANLKHADTQEKIVLPAKEDIDAEKGQQALRQGIEAFDQNALKKTETCEKNPLPTKETIEQEKSA